MQRELKVCRTATLVQLNQFESVVLFAQSTARTLEALEAELKPALDTITAQNARGWIRHAGYALP